MTVIRSVEIRDGRQGGVQGKFQWAHTRVWDVTTNSADDDDYDVITGGVSASPDPTPLLYETHPSNGSAYCNNISATNTSEDGRGWKVTATYTNELNPQENEENPPDRPPRVSWSFAQFQELAEKDREDKPITNTAKQAFDPPVERDASNIILNYTRIEASYSPSLAMQYQDTVNEGNFLGAPAGTAKVQAITANQMYENGTLYWEVTYEIHFRRDGWARKILNRGTLHRSSSSSTVFKPTQDREPRNLTINSVLIPKGSTDGIHYVTADVYEEADFDNLNIVLP